MTALIWASGRGHTEVVDHLLEAGANPDAADKVQCNASDAGTLSSRSGFIGRSERPCSSADTIHETRRKKPHMIKNWLFHVSRPLGCIDASMEV